MSNLLALAVLPGLLLIKLVYGLDKIEKEPVSLLVKLFFLGVLSVISAFVLEMIGDFVLECFVEADTFLYHFIDAFFVVAISEEFGKYLMLKKGTWKNREFDYRFDAIVYSVCVSAGFAVAENIMYVISGGIATGLMRAFTAVPGHVVFAIFMGYFYGEAKQCEVRDDSAGVSSNLRKAVLIPMLIHGFYDFTLFVGGWLVLVFFVFIIFLYRNTYKRVKKYASEDRALVENQFNYVEDLFTGSNTYEDYYESE